MLEYKDKHIHVKLFNSLGELMYSNSFYVPIDNWVSSIDMGDFNEGIYYLNIYDEERDMISYRLIKLN